MAFQPVPNAASAVVNGRVGSIPFVNVFHVVLAGELDETTADQVYADLSTLWDDHLTGALSDTYDVGSVVVTDLQTETGPQFTYSGGADFDGNEAGQALPFQTAALISWYTGTRGASFRGRNYFGPFCENGSSGRDLHPDNITLLEGFVTAFLAADTTFGIVSRFSGVDEEGHPIPRDEGIITAITSGVVHPHWRTQRRRALFTD